MAEQVHLDSRIKQIIEVDGLRFRDLDGDGQLTPFEDWRLSPAERAADLVRRMSPDEKIGLMVITSRPMGISQRNKEMTSHDGVLDEQYLPIKLDPHTSAGIPFEGTTQMISELGIRHFIMREEPTGSRIATWINTMNEVAEHSRFGIPVIVAANSKNEAGAFKMGGTPEDLPFTQWPGTLGLAATGSLELIESFAEHSRAEWRASGLRKGYMYMADVLTDPRWFRGQGTLGEDPEFVSRAIGALVRGFQGAEGLERDGVALTTKHFPGGGARENGTDPHYAEGRFNIYPTPGSLEEYHLPPFQAAIDAGTSSVMPYYAIPSDEKSSTPQGRVSEFEQVGFAFNREILDLLRQMGHRGYINSDSGVLSKMAWGVEELTTAERVGRAVMAGTDMFADTNDVASVREAYVKGHFTSERLDESAALLLEELFALGLFENPYVDPEQADAVVQNPQAQAAAEDAHRRSVVLAKNQRRGAAAERRGPGGQAGLRRAVRDRADGQAPGCAAPAARHGASGHRLHHRSPRGGCRDRAAAPVHRLVLRVRGHRRPEHRRALPHRHREGAGDPRERGHSGDRAEHAVPVAARRDRAARGRAAGRVRDGLPGDGGRHARRLRADGEAAADVPDRRRGDRGGRGWPLRLPQ